MRGMGPGEGGQPILAAGALDTPSSPLPQGLAQPDLIWGQASPVPILTDLDIVWFGYKPSLIISSMWSLPGSGHSQSWSFITQGCWRPPAAKWTLSTWFESSHPLPGSFLKPTSLVPAQSELVG